MSLPKRDLSQRSQLQKAVKPAAKAVAKKPAAKALAKKAAAKALAKVPAKTDVTKKPAAKLARPTPEDDAKVASTIDLGEFYKKLRACMAGSTHKNFTSIAWHRANKFAKGSGFGDSDAMAVGRHAARHASNLFSKKV